MNTKVVVILVITNIDISENSSALISMFIWKITTNNTEVHMLKESKLTTMIHVHFLWFPYNGKRVEILSSRFKNQVGIEVDEVSQKEQSTNPPTFACSLEI